MIETGGPSAGHRIGFEVNPDNRNCARYFHRSSYGIWSGSDDHIAFQLHEFINELGKTAKQSLVDTGFDDCVLAINVPHLSQRLHEYADVLVTSSLEESNPRHLPRLLRLSDKRRGEHGS